MHPTDLMQSNMQLDLPSDMPSIGQRMRRAFSVRGLVCAGLLAVAPAAAFAQAAQPAQGQRIQDQMTAAQFKAAGLDQLDATQLANLNTWLNRTLEVETSKAAEVAAAQAREAESGQSDGGFFDGGWFDGESSDAIESRIVGTFDGFGEGLEYTLDNGQVWVQTDSANLEGVTLSNPEVTIEPGVFGVWYLTVGDYNTRAKVKRVK